MTKRQKRMVMVAVLVVGVGAAAALALTAFRKNIMYYQKPSDLLSGNIPAGAAVQLGGMVENGSVRRGDGLKIDFIVTDCSASVPVRYEGVLPDLFREGQGVVATGHLDAGRVFVASTILAKHDENYMPPDVAKSMAMVGGKPVCPAKASTAGTRDSGLGTRGKSGTEPREESEVEAKRLLFGTRFARASLCFCRSRVPSPESRVPASP